MSHAILLLRFFKISVKNLTYYRANFLFIILYWMISLSVLLIFWKVLFNYLPESVGDWTFEGLCLLNSLCYISWGIFVLFWGFHQIPQKVITGELDKFLARPIHPLLGLIGEEIHLEAIYEILAGMMGVLLVSLAFDLRPTITQLLACMGALTLGTLVLVLVHGVVSLASFWLGPVASLQHLLDTMDEFQKYPLHFYPHSFRWVLMFLIPLYFPGSFAARLYLGLPVPGLHWVALLTSFILWAGLFILLYKKCLRHYEANG